MSDTPVPEAPSPDERPGDNRLDSWKEIAAYVRRDITTVQRWEKREGMPVHRHVHDKKGSVYAFRNELDLWARSRNLPVTNEDKAIEPVLDQADWSAAGNDLEKIEATPPAASPSTAGWARRSRMIWMAGGVLLTVMATWWLLDSRSYFWRNPLAGAAFQSVTDFAGIEQAAAVSRDGRLAAFLSDRDGRMDVWVTQVGTGQFYNLTRGRVRELVNPSVRTLGFSPDGALVTFWARDVSGSGDIAIWAVPTLGGEPRLYLEGVAEFDWSADGSRLVYHTPGPGDPMFVRESGDRTQGRQIFAATAGLHAHFPVWSQDGSYIYFVQGTLPDGMDIWRIKPTGGAAGRITHHHARVSHPVVLDNRTLMYLAADRDGSGPWLYSVDVERRTTNRVSAGLERYTSLSASADGKRLLATVSNPKGTLWRVATADKPVDGAAAAPISLTTGSGFAPRLAQEYLLYVSSKGANDGIWKLANGAATELWSAPDARIIGGPEVAADGRSVAFSVQQRGKTLLYVMNADGMAARVITDSFELRGAPAWAPDGRSIASAALVDGTPHLFSIALDGTVTPLVPQYAVDPVWSPAGDFIVYSGADIGTTFAVKAATPAGQPHPFPNLALTRGARRLRFFPGRPALVVLRGEIQHKNLWLIDLQTGAERQLTNLPPDFNVRDFDLSPDGREIVLERQQHHSDIVLVELARRD
jgi:Tol biopolymer transport system component